MAVSALRPALAAALAVALLPSTGSSAAPAAGGPVGETRPRAAELDLESLMAEFAKVRSIRAQFVETKQLALLDAPIQSSGEMVILPPSRLYRRTDKPAAATLVIDGDALRFEDALGREDIDLAAQPEARQFVDQMLAVMSGDLAALRARYALSYRADDDHWTLRLVPNTYPMKHLISEIALVGDGPELREMAISETDGDVTRTTFAHTQLDFELADSELERLFGASSPGAAAR